MASAKGMNSTKNHITRRAFLSGAIAVAGGLVMLSFPDRVLASYGGATIYGPSGNDLSASHIPNSFFNDASSCPLGSFHAAQYV